MYSYRDQYGGKYGGTSNRDQDRLGYECCRQIPTALDTTLANSQQCDCIGLQGRPYRREHSARLPGNGCWNTGEPGMLVNEDPEDHRISKGMGLQTSKH